MSQLATPGWHLRQLPHSRKDILFILDPRGRVRFISAPESFSAPGADLIGEPISRLVPALPLNESTPGYNIAFSGFAFAGGQWKTYQVSLPDGTMLAAEIRITPVSMDPGHFLFGLMRLKPRLNAAGREAIRSPAPADQNDRRALIPTRLAV
jgi:hypothetical protein